LHGGNEFEGFDDCLYAFVNGGFGRWVVCAHGVGSSFSEFSSSGALHVGSEHLAVHPRSQAFASWRLLAAMAWPARISRRMISR
jgi:hypothetical protein